MIAARSIGAPLDRADGKLKVTGAARYAFEQPVENVAYLAVGRLCCRSSHLARG